MNNLGKTMYKWATDVFPICRSITGNGTRETLKYFQALLPGMTLHDVPSGTQVFDWTVPDEWNITDAFIADASGQRVVDFKQSNLHVIGYSEPVDRHMTFAELDAYLHSLPEQPDAIPYLTSYYKRHWGFCINEQQRVALRQNPNATYHVKINSTIAPGSLTYGELIIPGESEKEILLSTYVCHPSMANNELSGPCVAAALAQWIASLPKRHFTYRILFLVETIGTIAYLSQHLDVMKRNTIAGFVLTCLGDNNDYSYIPSRFGNTVADRVAQQVLSLHAPYYKRYSFLDRGSDERQYCAPGVDLPVCSVIRSKYGVYPEYHTSLDNLSFISPEGLRGGYEVLKKCIEWLECHPFYQNTTLCEPQLGKRGLYPALSTKGSKNLVRDMMNFLAYADGTRDIASIADLIGVEKNTLMPTVERLLSAGVIKRI